MPRAFLVGINLARNPEDLDNESSLDELAALADSVGLEVAGQTLQHMTHVDPKTLLSVAKLSEIKAWVEKLNITNIVFDDELLPRHQRELENYFGRYVRVLDRTAVILDIFARHARSREGILQVSLAQYEYLLPRLTRQWTHFARQTGSTGARGGVGGVGLRGPGETQLETDRRQIRQRIHRLRAEINAIRTHRYAHRLARQQRGFLVAALFGYTNTGKSSLLNALCESEVYVADQLFATLDPTTRRARLPDGKTILVTDTVGFIRKLPHTLVAAFRATHEEIMEADLLIHVIDASDPQALNKSSAALGTLRHELGVTDKKLITVLNKIDLIKTVEDTCNVRLLEERFPGAIKVSCVENFGLDNLLIALQHMLTSNYLRICVRIPYRESTILAKFRELAVSREDFPEESHIVMAGAIPPAALHVFNPYVVGEVRGEHT